MKKSDEKTKRNLEKLSASLGEFNLHEKKEREIEEIKTDSYFKTSEVIILLLLTTVVSLIMGGLVAYRIIYNTGRNIDKELSDFIKNYEYIKENYYGDIDKTKLIDSAIAGMLTALDKNSSYVGNADSSFNVFLEGNYKGIGLQVYNDENNNVILTCPKGWFGSWRHYY